MGRFDIKGISIDVWGAGLRLDIIKQMKKEGYNMAKFKAGDRVRIRSWKSMETEFGLDSHKCIDCRERFAEDMKHLCGRTATIESIYKEKICLNNWSNTDGDIYWSYSIDMIEPAGSHSIHITTEGDIVHAILKDGGKIVKRAKAVCAPSDIFDFETGAKLAFDRLFAEEVRHTKKELARLYCFKDCKPGEWFTKGKTYIIDADDRIASDDGYRAHGKEYRDNYGLCGGHWKDFLVPEVKREAKVGEWIKITVSKEDRAINGQIYQVVEATRYGTFIKHPDGMRHSDNAANISDSEYVVLENYTPPKEPEKPKYYSGKVVCVEKTDLALTVGKVYAVKNGNFTFDGGYTYQTKSTNLHELNDWFVGGKFIEFKCECTGK